MPKYSNRSIEKLEQCHEQLQCVFNKVIKHIDCTLLCGHRDEETQNEMCRTLKSKLAWPHSKHNQTPSLAIDVAPYPIDWQDRERATLFAGFVMGVAFDMGITLRWGGDWNRNWRVKDNHFDDLWHFELVHERYRYV